MRFWIRRATSEAAEALTLCGHSQEG